MSTTRSSRRAAAEGLPGRTGHHQSVAHEALDRAALFAYHVAEQWGRIHPFAEPSGNDRYLRIPAIAAPFVG